RRARTRRDAPPVCRQRLERRARCRRGERRVSADDPIDLRLLPGSSTVDDRGHLVIGGSDLEQLARVFSTPLYVYDEDEVVARCRAYAEAFGADAVAYAAKAFLCGAMARIVA